MMEGNYMFGECETCANRGDPYCVGCQLERHMDGTWSRTRYTTKKSVITYSSAIQTDNAKEGK